MPTLRVAIDCTFGNKSIKRLESMGCLVVAVAKPGEPDIDWLKRAVKERALFIISGDSDLSVLIERYNYPAIWIRDDNTKSHRASIAYENIMNKLYFAKNISRQFSG